MSRSQVSKTSNSLVLIQSIRDLLTLLATLPMDLRFTNTWLSPPAEAFSERPRTQIVLLYQSVHEYIMVSLVRFSQRGSTNDVGQLTIRLPESLQIQMIVSCLEILAILDHFIIGRQEEALLRTHIFQQTSIAADILGWPELLPYIPPYRMYIQQTITRLQHMYHQQPQLLPEATVNALRQLLSMVDQYMLEHSVHGPREPTDGMDYALRQNVRPFSDPQHIYPSMESTQSRSLYRQSDPQVCSSLNKPDPDIDTSATFDHDGVLIAPKQVSWGFTSDTKSHHKHKDGVQLVYNGDKFKTRTSTYAGQAQNSTTLVDTSSTTAHGLPHYSASSTASISSTFEPSYSASVHTPSSSSQYSPKISHSVSPMTDPRQLHGYGPGSQLPDCMSREYSDSKQFWTCDYI